LTPVPPRAFSVGLIAPEFPPDIGGVETYSFELAKALAELGHRVTVFTVAHAGGEATLPGVPILPLLRLRRRLDRRLLQDHPMQVWHTTNAAYGWLALETSNVALSVHGNDFLFPYVDVGRLDLERAPLLWRLQGAARERLAEIDRRLGQWRTQRLLARSLPRVPCIVTNSRYTESMLLDRFPACRGSTSVGLVGVGSEFLALKPSARPQDARRRLLTVCRISEPRKNVDLVLRALAPLKGRYSFTYTIIGDGTRRESLERLTRDLGLSDVVRFLGRVPKDELIRQMTAADLFILTSSTLPSSHEGFGIAYLEANAAGVPVLAARLAGAIEAVNEGVSGIFVDEPTVPQIEAAIERFLSGEVKFDAERCREWAGRFTWKRIADLFSACYERIAHPA
jgi:phosphatidylinositol alpha-1,6-mannosyltransferase